MKRQYAPLFVPMEKQLQDLSKPQMLSMARSFSAKHELPPPDRLCRRSREALTCWFCQHAPNFPAEFLPLREEESPPAEARIIQSPVEPIRQETQLAPDDVESGLFDFLVQNWDSSSD
jgi:hypothetical protein